MKVFYIFSPNQMLQIAGNYHFAFNHYFNINGSFRNYVTAYFKKIESDIQQLKKVSAPPIQDSAKIITKEVENRPAETGRDTPVKGDENYWKSSFEKTDESFIPSPLQEQIPVEKVGYESIKNEELAQATVANADRYTANSSKRKPSFFEKNPDIEKFIGENLVS